MSRATAATHCPSADRTRGRRARREANDQLLSSSCGGAPTAADLADLFSHTTPSFWPSWQALSALPDDDNSDHPTSAPPARTTHTRKDKRKRQHRSERAENNTKDTSSTTTTTNNINNNPDNIDDKPAAVDPLRRVNPRLRPLLRQGYVEPLLRRIDAELRALRDGRARHEEITFVLASSRERAVAHGVASYYALTHFSTVTPPPECARVTVVRRDERARRREREGRARDEADGRRPLVEVLLGGAALPGAGGAGKGGAAPQALGGEPARAVVL